jgi:hypothetical protein
MFDVILSIIMFAVIVIGSIVAIGMIVYGEFCLYRMKRADKKQRFLGDL